MSIPGDTLTGLSRLSNRRKVKSAGNPEDPYVPDLEGTSSDGMLPPPVDPMGDMGMGNPAQSLDPRANNLINTETENQDPTDLYQLGRNLGSMVGQGGEGEEEIPRRSDPQELQSGFTMGPVYKAIGDYFSPSKRAEVSQQNQQRMAQIQEARPQPASFGQNPYQDMGYEQFANLQEQRGMARDAGVPLDQYQQQRDTELQDEQTRFQEGMNQALQEPYSTPVFGATDLVMNTPELKAQYEQFVPERTPDQERRISQYEAILDDMSQEQMVAKGLWDEQIASAKQRIEQNQATDMDKYMIGLALVMPLIVGGLFGAEAGIGAFSGATQGLTDVYDRRAKTIQGEEDRISELGKLRSQSDLTQKKIELEKLKVPKEIGGTAWDHLKGKEKISYQTPEGEKIGFKLAPNLYAQPDYVTDKEDLKRMNKNADDLAESKTPVDQLGMQTRRLMQIANQSSNKGNFQKLMSMGADKITPSLVDKLGEQVMLDGKMVNSATAMRQIKEQLVQTRRDAEKIKNFSPILFTHMDNILSNPFTTFTSWDDMKDQILRLYTTTRDVYLQDATNKGFLKEPLLSEFAKTDKRMYDTLNKVEQIKKGKEKEVKRQTEMVEVPDARESK